MKFRLFLILVVFFCFTSLAFSNSTDQFGSSVKIIAKVVNDNPIILNAYPNIISANVKFTSLSYQAGMPLETGLLNFKKYNGKIISIVGRDFSNWICNSQIISIASKEYGKVVEKIFSAQDVSQKISVIGIIKENFFYPLGKQTKFKITNINMQDAVSPKEIDLSPFELQLVVVRGLFPSLDKILEENYEWVYSAEIIHSYQPIESALLMKLMIND